MEIGYRRFFVALVLLLVANTAAVANLCNQNCLLTATFPSGGSIEAVAALTITFGDGGLVDTVGSVTAYVAGETLTLNAGESLDFGSGGSFDIGNAGNIDFTDMAIITAGEITLSAVGGDEEVLIPAASRLAFSGGGQIDNGSTIVLGGILDLGADATLNVSGPTQPDGCDLSSTGGATLAISGASPLVLDNDSGCTVLNTTLATTPALTAGSLALTNPVTNTVVANFTPPIVGVINAGALTPAETEEEPRSEAGAATETTSASDSSGALGTGVPLLLLLAMLAVMRRMRMRI